MSFKATLSVGGKKVNILNANYDLAQEVDATGRPSSVTRGGRIYLTVESTGDSFFFEWMTNNFERKNGVITYIKRDTDAKLREVHFTEGYLVKYKENFDHRGDNPLTETFAISCRVIASGGGEHINEWV
ncbi:type VI secretion system tube protein TssD [Sinomicrobium weinanense]|uniref:Phage tail protein n=1 Tax=Sinomicrobium weinanense TaxID=2842200 RepID=A0A926JW07_9FLAO|nr:type VI secretion system tube protein TssD [Sinomicrobium weinanense]MBC9798186.1 phage tail protein [Sinomicrobium weinanense]MBU3125488.1 phage tail protein [Sinomicrobium weinanense]